MRVADAEGRVIGYRVFNPHSQYRVRILSRGEADFEGIEAWVQARVSAAAELRRVFGLPSAETTAYRLLNSEGDGVSGLSADVFGDAIVVSSSAFWTERWRPEIERALGSAVRGQAVWRRAAKVLAQDGWTESHVASTPLAVLTVREGGLRYRVTPGAGQKTGFYCDQRENRARVRSLAAGRRVLDLFCYTGGFALNAAAGGASVVTAVDSSADAIGIAEENARENGVTVEFVRQDAESLLESSREEYDLIVLDPPKLAPSRKLLDRAVKHYRRLNKLALARLGRGGILVTFSCSAAIDRAALEGIVRDAAGEVHLDLRITSELGAGADHPIHPAFPEGRYLTGLIGYAP